MAYIEKEPLCAWLENMGVSDFIVRRIESETHFPAVDVEKVVRCKDCEHYSLAMLKCCLPSDDKHSFDNYAPPIWQPNDFCSYGTPKERGD